MEKDNQGQWLAMTVNGKNDQRPWIAATMTMEFGKQEIALLTRAARQHGDMDFTDTISRLIHECCQETAREYALYLNTHPKVAARDKIREEAKRMGITFRDDGYAIAL